MLAARRLAAKRHLAPGKGLWARGAATRPRMTVSTATLSGPRLGKAGGSGEVNWNYSPLTSVKDKKF